jgi:hypothetical protein
VCALTRTQIGLNPSRAVSSLSSDVGFDFAAPVSVEDGKHSTDSRDGGNIFRRGSSRSSSGGENVRFANLDT